MQLSNSLSAARYFRSHELYETFDIERKFKEDISNLIVSVDTMMITAGCMYTRDEHRFKHRLSDACSEISCPKISCSINRHNLGLLLKKSQANKPTNEDM